MRVTSSSSRCWAGHRYAPRPSREPRLLAGVGAMFVIQVGGGYLAGRAIGHRNVRV